MEINPRLSGSNRLHDKQGKFPRYYKIIIPYIEFFIPKLNIQKIEYSFIQIIH